MTPISIFLGVITVSFSICKQRSPWLLTKGFLYNSWLWALGSAELRQVQPPFLSPIKAKTFSHTGRRFLLYRKKWWASRESNALPSD